ncbi:tetratricopeptide repeat-containing sulfotransferase family protein [Thalassotalea crassostreae]|uniref:tetratricopeptide repeat-containing sulfotransferase family protein n=1 Tax=Thalassotalea crassostreae TaxID=1763536 RepID=UPI000837F4F5|nr:sulfotransferase [Thalassotalea crassostreae]
MTVQSSSQLELKKLIDSGWRSLDTGDVKQAISISQNLTKNTPNFASGWYFTAQVALRINNMAAAIQSLKNACKLQPRNTGWKLALAHTLLNTAEYEQARLLLDSLSHPSPRDNVNNSSFSAIEQNQLALLYARLNQNTQAVKHYLLACELEPNNYDHYYSLAAVYRQMGNISQAIECLKKAITLNPLDIDSHVLLVDTEKQTADQNHIETLVSLLAKASSNKQRVQINFALAKCYESIGNYEQSFSALTAGANLRRSEIQYQSSSDAQIIKTIINTFSKDWNQQQIDSLTPELTPIFIVGLPRTGSTLVEQLLCADDSVYSGGEMNDFSRLLMKQVRTQQGNKPLNPQQLVEASKNVNFQKLGEDYINAVRQQLNMQNSISSGYFTDKLPLNYLYLGLIKKALPNAKFIHVKRNPMDSCYAMYKTLFEQVYPFSYEQKELAQYYGNYKMLMEHWQACEVINIFNVDYEDLVADPENTCARLFEHCDIIWHSHYRQLARNQGAVKTASSVQVREEIYKGSVQRWRHYEQQLKPLRSELLALGIDINENK